MGRALELTRPLELSQGTLEIVETLLIMVLGLVHHAECVEKFSPPPDLKTC